MKYYYDFHIHSCLSPCADNDNTPNNIAGMAQISGLNIVALTDHNTVKNCPAFLKAAKRFNIIALAGMELTTSEDIHVVFLFENLNDAINFNDEVQNRRILIKNRVEIFGEQLILDEQDNIIESEEHLLSNATTISIEECVQLANKYGAVCYPAHIDREANGIISVLGTVPHNLGFKCLEFKDKQNIESYKQKYNLEGYIFLTDSDAHYLENIPDKDAFIEIEGENLSEETFISRLFNKLKGGGSE